MIQVTPGVLFLGRGLVYLSVPFVVLKILDYGFDVGIPTWLLVVVSFLSVPFYGALRVFWTEMHHQREAAAMGAKLVPRAQGKWPGNIDVLIELMNKFHYGYPGALSEIFVTAFARRLYWTDRRRPARAG